MEAKSRQEARERNLNYYNTGKSCKNGHLSKRYVNNATCYVCATLKNAIYQETHKEQYKTYKAKYFQTHKEKYKKPKKIKTKSVRQLALDNNELCYFSSKPCKRGHLSERNTKTMVCIKCRRFLIQQWRIAHKEERKSVEKLRHKVYKDSHKYQIRESSKIYRTNNTAKLRQYNKAWASANKDLVNAKTARRRSKKLQATPLWVDHEAIKEIYTKCPAGFQVDHIVPLQGIEVCGLHVPWNLQYLTKSDNVSKGNRLINDSVQ